MMSEAAKSEAKKPIKEGFLVKKGHVRRNWRTRWFTLMDDTLHYYKNRGDPMPAGSIDLAGASLIVPNSGTTKKSFLMQLSSLCGKELLVQAPDQATLTDWADSIEKVISEQAKQSLQASGAGSMRRNTASPPASQKDILQAMQDRDAGVKVQDVTLKTIQIKKCFSGEAAIDWLIAWYFAKDRNEAVSLAGEMLLEGHFQCVDHELIQQHCVGGPQRKITPTIMCREFIDSSFVYYKFSAFNPGQMLDLLDSSDESDSSSDDNDLLTTAANTQDSPWPFATPGDPAGPVIKQGFLMKKRLKHVKQDWKARKFIIRENSPYLYYCKGSKESKLSGSIPLKDCTVAEMDDKSDAASSVKQHIKRNRFSLTTSSGERVVMAAPTAEDRLSWLQTIRKVIKEFTSP
ncbi:pleckstrin-like [Dysidea avara]|uniref:pleckstrin-like n=1 Tax=Dysidea avara TaxID=196820 RepID=UPI003324272E